MVQGIYHLEIYHKPEKKSLILSWDTALHVRVHQIHMTLSGFNGCLLSESFLQISACMDYRNYAEVSDSDGRYLGYGQNSNNVLYASKYL